MQERDYIILFDENGQPYIEHGVFDRLKNSKYYQKIKTSYGWRYFYDPEEWQAYVNGQGNAPKSLIGKAKDKLGFDERERYMNAKDRFMKSYDSNPNSDTTHDLALKTHNAGVAYNKTALGSLENTAKDAKAVIKDRFQRMKEDLQKDAKYGEYTENDPDFNDENYKEENRIGDSDFYIYQRPDGRTVILEEDMKWVLPKNVDASSPAFRESIVKMTEKMNDEWSEEGRRAKIRGGQDPATFADLWVDDATRWINEAVKASRQNNK